MKKSLIIWLFLLYLVTVYGCWNKNNTEYDNNWVNYDTWFYVINFDEIDENDNLESWEQWVNVAKAKCEGEWWIIEELWHFSPRKGVCNYPDNSFCYLDSLLANECKKWDIMYNDGEVYHNPPKGQLNWKPIEEAFCNYNKWVITENEYWDRFCTFQDWWHYELRTFREAWEMPSLRWPDEPYCSDYEDIVCWFDGRSYVNECWMKVIWIEKDSDAKFVDGRCVSK